MRKSVKLLVLVASLCLASCSVPGDVAQTPVHANGNLTVEQAIISNLEQAKSSCVKLRDFKWQDLDGLGYWNLCGTGQACLTFDRIYHDEEDAGLFAGDMLWISIGSILPNGQQVSPLMNALDACLQNAKKLNTEVALIAEGEKTLRQVDSILKTALYLAENLKLTRKSQFNEIERSFDSASDKTKALYLEKFENQSSSYLERLDAVLSCLKQAQHDLQSLIPAPKT